MEEYDYDIIHNEIIHKAGRVNINTNALSYNAIREKHDTTEEREVFTIEIKNKTIMKKYIQKKKRNKYYTNTIP